MASVSVCIRTPYLFSVETWQTFDTKISSSFVLEISLSLANSFLDKRNKHRLIISLKKLYFLSNRNFFIISAIATMNFIIKYCNLGKLPIQTLKILGKSMLSKKRLQCSPYLRVKIVLNGQSS